jgi:polycystin 1L2
MDYTPLAEESGNFNPGWTPYKQNSTATKDPTWRKMYSAFTYRTASSLDSLPITAKYTTYMGGGYVYDMVPTLNKTTLQNEIATLQSLGWIDLNTRAIFLELSLFNPNINLFAHGTVIFEFLPTGSLIVSNRFDLMKLLNSSSGFQVLALVCYIIYIVIILFFVLREIVSWKKLGTRQYFSQIWTYAEWLLIIFSFVGLAMYAYQQYALNDAL